MSTSYEDELASSYIACPECFTTVEWSGWAVSWRCPCCDSRGSKTDYERRWQKRFEERDDERREEVG